MTTLEGVIADHANQTVRSGTASYTNGKFTHNVSMNSKTDPSPSLPPPVKVRSLLSFYDESTFSGCHWESEGGPLLNSDRKNWNVENTGR